MSIPEAGNWCSGRIHGRRRGTVRARHGRTGENRRIARELIRLSGYGAADIGIDSSSAPGKSSTRNCSRGEHTLPTPTPQAAHRKSRTPPDAPLDRGLLAGCSRPTPEPRKCARNSPHACRSTLRMPERTRKEPWERACSRMIGFASKLAPTPRHSLIAVKATACNSRKACSAASGCYPPRRDCPRSSRYGTPQGASRAGVRVRRKNTGWACPGGGDVHRAPSLQIHSPQATAPPPDP